MPDPVRDRPLTTEEIGRILSADGSAWAREQLDGDVVGWLTTRSPDGRLQSSVVSFLWDGSSIVFYSRPATPKIRNIERSPQVSFHLNSDPFGDRVLTIEGLAAIDPTIPPSDVEPVYRAKYRGPLEHWGMDEAETAASFSVPIRITPLRIRLA
jgi:PPOX class probable F420-dependent enzyme